MEKLEYCYECNKDVVPVIKCEKNNYTYRNKEFTVVEDIHYCPLCNTELLNDNIDSSMHDIYDGYLKLFNLSFDKLKKIRTNLNLSQELMAKILGWSKKSIVRYENAESIPQGEYLNMYITLNENPYYIMKILEGKRKIFEDKEYYKILRILPFYDKYKTINSILYLLDNNSLCETSLMKNLFAVDFENYKEYNISMTNLKYAHLPYGPVVDKRNDLYNFMLRNNYIRLEITEDKVLFIANYDYDKKLFTDGEMEILKFVKDKLK